MSDDKQTVNGNDGILELMQFAYGVSTIQMSVRVKSISGTKISFDLKGFYAKQALDAIVEILCKEVESNE